MSNERKNIMLCRNYNESILKKWTWPILAQPKLNGDRCLAYIDHKGAVLKSSQDNIIVSVPHINEELNMLGITAILDGELYVHGMSHQKIRSITSRTKNLHDDYRLIEYHVFDIKSQQEQVYRDINRFRVGIHSNNIIYGEPKVKFVRDVTLGSISAIERQLKTYLEQGYEGIILRNPAGLYVDGRSSDLMKLKPRKNGSFTIIGYLEETSCESTCGLIPEGIPKGSLGSFICENSAGKGFRVGSGPVFTRQFRTEAWQHRQDFVGKELAIKFQEMSDTGIPIFPIAFEIIDV